MKSFIVVLCLALAHGAFAQRGFFSSLGNAAYANADAANSLIGAVGSGMNKGISLGRGAVGLGTSAGRMGLSATTGILGGVANANLNAMGAINNRFVPSGIATPVNHLLNAGSELEQAKLSAMTNLGTGVLNGIDGMANFGAGVSSFGVNTVTGAMMGGNNLMAGAVNGVTGAMGSLANLANLPQQVLAQAKPMLAEFMKSMPVPTMRLFNKLKAENVFDYIKEKMDELNKKIHEIVDTYKQIFNEITQNITGADLKQLGEELVGNMTELIKGNQIAVDNILTTIESKIPTLANYDSQMRNVLEHVQKRFVELGEIGQELADNLEKAKATYDEIKAKLTEEKLNELLKDIKTDFASLVEGDSSAIDTIISRINTNYPELAAYEANIRSGLQTVQKIAQDIKGFMPILGDIMGKAGQVASYPETQAFISQAARSMQNVASTPGYSNLMSSIPSFL